MANLPRLLALTLVMLFTATGVAAPTVSSKPVAAPGPGTVPIGQRLSPPLKKLLAEEMVAINTASMKIVEALASGNAAVVAKQAQAIHDSFILAKKLTKDDRAALEKALPPGFVVLDAQFHAKAQRLALVAQRGDLELANFFFGRMIETCQACHSRFATGKFPAFAPKRPQVIKKK